MTELDPIGPLKVVRAFEPKDFCVYSDGRRTRVALGARKRIVACGSWGEIAEAFAGVEHAYGYLAFDLARLDHAYAHSIAVPLHFIVPEVHCIFQEDGTLDVWPDEARGRVEDALAAPGAITTAALLDLDPGAGRPEYRLKLKSALERVRAGELEKVIITRTVTRAAHLDVLGTYERALSNHAIRRFCFQLGDVKGVGTCPDVFMLGQGDEVFSTVLAGTKPRGRTAEEDEALRRELLADAKEVREHVLSIKHAQEEMLHVAAPSDVWIRDFMEIKRYPFTQHITSQVRGRLSPGKSFWDAVRSLFPGVTCTGVPRRLAIPLISELEGAPRGVYGGCFGFYAGGSTLDLGITLRSAFEYSGLVSMSAGAGMVAESDLDYEVEESVNKMRTIAKHLVGQLL